MTGPLVSDREAALIRKLDATVADGLARNGVRITGAGEQMSTLHTALRAALVDVGVALARELGQLAEADVADAPGVVVPPVHSPPSEPGAVVLARQLRGVELDPPLLLMRSWDVVAGAPCWVSGEDVCASWTHPDDALGDWLPARVVEDAEVLTAARLSATLCRRCGHPRHEGRVCGVPQQVVAAEIAAALACGCVR